MSFNYIETTCEPQPNLCVVLDESSLELCPQENPPTPTPEEISVETIISDLDTCITSIFKVQDKLSECSLTKL